MSDVGFGILGQTNGDGIDVAGVGSGRFYQAPMFAQGAPTTGSFMVGEQIRDKIGDLYIFVQHGSSGVWRRVAAGLPGLSGSVNFLANPIRLLDTRTGSPYAAGSVHSVQVVGVVLDGRSIPQGVVGVIGNVTVVNPTSGGDLRLYPAASLPVTSTINFAAGQIIANGVTVGLDSNGRLNIKVDMASGAHTDVLFDASGFIL